MDHAYLIIISQSGEEVPGTGSTGIGVGGGSGIPSRFNCGILKWRIPYQYVPKGLLRP